MVVQIEFDRVTRAELIGELLTTLEREALLREEAFLRLHRQLHGLRPGCLRDACAHCNDQPNERTVACDIAHEFSGRGAL